MDLKYDGIDAMGFDMASTLLGDMDAGRATYYLGRSSPILFALMSIWRPMMRWLLRRYQMLLTT